MTEDSVGPEVSKNDVRRILDANPAFARTVQQFSVLYDAAEVIDELKPPQHEISAPYLRAIADNVMRRDTAMGEDFLQAMIKGRPPLGRPAGMEERGDR